MTDNFPSTIPSAPIPSVSPLPEVHPAPIPRVQAVSVSKRFRVLLAAALLLLLVVGGVTAFVLASTSQDVRQQASGGTYHDCGFGKHGVPVCVDTELNRGNCIVCIDGAKKVLPDTACVGLPCHPDQHKPKCSDGKRDYDEGQTACLSSTQCVQCQSGSWKDTASSNCGSPCGNAAASPTPTHQPTGTPVLTLTLTTTPSPTVSVTLTPSPTLLLSLTPSPTVSSTPTPSSTTTPTPTLIIALTATPTVIACKEECPGKDGVLRDCHDPEDGGSSKDSLCNSAGRLESCGVTTDGRPKVFCCSTDGKWTSDLVACGSAILTGTPPAPSPTLPGAHTASLLAGQASAQAPLTRLGVLIEVGLVQGVLRSNSVGLVGYQSASCGVCRGLACLCSASCEHSWVWGGQSCGIGDESAP